MEENIKKCNILIKILVEKFRNKNVKQKVLLIINNLY